MADPCTACGAAVSGTGRFCTECGRPSTSAAPAPPEAEPEPRTASRIPPRGRSAAAVVLAGAVVGIVLAVSGGSPEPAADADAHPAAGAR